MRTAVRLTTCPFCIPFVSYVVCFFLYEKTKKHFSHFLAIMQCKEGNSNEDIEKEREKEYNMNLNS
jgi:hypothetical protein